MVHLRTVGLKHAPEGETFPFSVPAIRTLQPLDLSAEVTFFVGENGSGKSTLLEGIAAAAKLPTVGGNEIDRDATLEAQRRLDPQFIIATHSPLLLAFPGTRITLTCDFLNDPAAFLRRL